MTYKHYKGGLYRKLFVAKMSEDHETKVVVYVSLSNGEIWVRPQSTEPGVDAWADIVKWPDGVDRPRFILHQD